MGTSGTHTLAPGPACRILYAEDDPNDAKLCLRQLEQVGFRLSADIVASAEEFLRALAESSYDLILADYNLPGWSGMEALEILGRDGRDIPFILVTGTVGEETAVECIKSGATDYVLKDRPARLPLAVARALKETRVRDERRQAEQSRDLLAAIVESSDDAIIGQALDGSIVSWNRGAERIYGYGAEEIRGQPISVLFRAKGEELEPVIDALRRGGTAERFEAKGARKDGTLLDVAVTISPIRDRDGAIAGASVITRDITEHLLLQREYFVAQKMEVVGRFAAGIAHDFNNVLTVVAGYSDLALSELDPDDPLHPLISEIGKSGQRAASLTRQLLAFCSNRTLEPKVLNVNAIVAEMDRMLRRVIGEDIELVTALDPQLGSTRADPGQIEQVIMNLAVNARDAMAAGGKLTLETANVEVDPAYSERHVGVAEGSSVMIAMTDTGTGMDAETQSRIFEPFFTTKATGVGTGLGLATVFGIVKQSGGSILVYSELGYGTTFKIYLPRVLEQAAAVEPPRAHTPARGSETVLVVEDEDTIRALVSTVLKKQGHTVLQAKNGREALELCRQHSGKIDLVISDLVMPLMSGAELAKELVAARPEIKVLFMSGYTGNAAVHHGVVPPNTAFLEKPFVPRTLTRKLREVLDRA